MSDSVAYISEPPTTGKVIIQTSLGDIDVELWCKEMPLATRNFIQLALEGMYDGVIFHRIVKDFLCQSGDFTQSLNNNNSLDLNNLHAQLGGSSIYGHPFKDEFHSRIRFNRRGLLAMAGGGSEKDNNESQFFFTLGQCQWLQGKHTIFGKVTGDTIYNLMALNDVEVNENDRPLNPPFINNIQVINNPFTDIKPRSTKKQRESDMLNELKADQLNKQRNKNQKLNKINKHTLSFQEEAEEEEKEKQTENSQGLQPYDDQHSAQTESENQPKVGKSFHEIIQNSNKSTKQNEANNNTNKNDINRLSPSQIRRSLIKNENQKDSKAKQEEFGDGPIKGKGKGGPLGKGSESFDNDNEIYATNELEFDLKMKQKILASRSKLASNQLNHLDNNDNKSNNNENNLSQNVKPGKVKKLSAAELKAQLIALTSGNGNDQLLNHSNDNGHTTHGSDNSNGNNTHSSSAAFVAPVSSSDLQLLPQSQLKRQTLIGQRKNENVRKRQEDTLAKLAAFQNKIIKSSVSKENEKDKTKEKENENEMEEENGTFLNHTIKFTKRPQDFDLRLLAAPDPNIISKNLVNNNNNHNPNSNSISEGHKKNNVNLNPSPGSNVKHNLIRDADLDLEEDNYFSSLRSRMEASSSRVDSLNNYIVEDQRGEWGKNKVNQNEIGDILTLQKNEQKRLSSIIHKQEKEKNNFAGRSKSPSSFRKRKKSSTSKSRSISRSRSRSRSNN